MKCFKPIVVRVSEGIMRELMSQECANLSSPLVLNLKDNRTSHVSRSVLNNV